jgi:hypothetical protein
MANPIIEYARLGERVIVHKAWIVGCAPVEVIL